MWWRGCHMFWGAPWYGGYWNPFSWIIPLFVIGIILLGIWYLIKTSRRDTSSDSALEILRNRYASGEISREEYYKLLNDIKK